MIIVLYCHLGDVARFLYAKGYKGDKGTGYPLHGRVRV